MKQYHILLVDDDPLILKTLGAALENKEYEVTTVDSGEVACELLETESFDLVITDLVMGETGGIMVLDKAKSVNSGMGVILLTGHGNIESAIDAIRLQADDYILKPCENEEIFFHVEHCLERVELLREIKLYEDIFPVCMKCKKIRNDAGKVPGTGEWVSIEKYLYTRAGMNPSHTFCPECLDKELEEVF